MVSNKSNHENNKNLLEKEICSANFFLVVAKIGNFPKLAREVALAELLAIRFPEHYLSAYIQIS